MDDEPGDEGDEDESGDNKGAHSGCGKGLKIKVKRERSATCCYLGKTLWLVKVEPLGRRVSWQYGQFLRGTQSLESEHETCEGCLCREQFRGAWERLGAEGSNSPKRSLYP